ncbi:MAG: hypothetical protein KGS72_21630 [Cyanobacteria bacterium REEB67]|nr:hypothetical protein [Cyanobacteria bacterium REEB67]
MGPNGALAWVLGILAFLVAGGVASLFGPLSFPVACAAAFFTWKHFNDKDKAELAGLLNPPEETWPVALPVAWGCICDVLRGTGIETGASGRANWQIQKEDEARGFIQAKLTFNQSLGAGANTKVVSREIHLTAQLMPEGDNTKVKCTYEIFSPMGTGMVRELIRKAQIEFRSYVEANKPK